MSGEFINSELRANWVALQTIVSRETRRFTTLFRSHVEKQYVVTLDTPLTDAMRRGFAAGVTLTDGETMAPAGVEPLTDDGLTVQVTLRQGVYHQIKRMFGVFDAGVNALHRESIGGVALDPALAPGQWRELTAEEVERLRTR